MPAPPLFDTDEVASMELLKLCFDVGIEQFEGMFSVTCSTLARPEVYGRGSEPALEAAIAAAFLGACNG